MAISNATHNLDLLRPLQIYRREPHIEAELAGLCGLSARMLMAHAEGQNDKALSNEALVAVTRAFLRGGQPELARRVLKVLAARITGRAMRHLEIWGVRRRELREDLHQEMVRMMCECVLCLEADREFWECRFWTCFDRKARTLLRGASGQANRALSLDRLVEASPAMLEDSAMSVERKTEIAVALQQIPEPYRTAFCLKHYGGYSIESGNPDEVTIERSLNVSGRTVRSYLKRAEKYLSKWRDSDAKH